MVDGCFGAAAASRYRKLSIQNYRLPLVETGQKQAPSVYKIGSESRK